MFTGIVTKVGTVAQISQEKLSVRADQSLIRKLGIGTSISVDGMCLSVVSRRKDMFTADIMPETVRRTNIRHFRDGTLVNLELPVTPASFLGGGIVEGHVDGVGVLKVIRKKGLDRILSIAAPRALMRYIVEKGSVTVNGISLTVINAAPLGFTVGIVPHTWSMTTLSKARVGDVLNIEADILAKYIEKLAAKSK